MRGCGENIYLLLMSGEHMEQEREESTIPVGFHGW